MPHTVLHCQTACFALQDGLFGNAKQCFLKDGMVRSSKVLDISCLAICILSASRFDVFFTKVGRGRRQANGLAGSLLAFLYSALLVCQTRVLPFADICLILQVKRG